MSDLPETFDLKFLPDWLKESPAKNPYANFEGDTGDRPRRDRDDRSPRGPRPERRGPAPGGERRGPRPDRPPGDRPRGPRPGGDRPRGDRPQGNRPQGDRRQGDRRQEDRRPGGRPHERRDEPRPPREAAPAQLKVEFLPEPIAAAGITKQIHSSGRAYPVFGTAKLFLERPERHLVRITSSDPAVPLFQVGDGPVSFDRATAERNAFLHARDQYYAAETEQGEPIKGNFTNVARCRATGTLLGPTNHHGYQPALRKLYEERFSRQMSFQDFQQHEIAIVSDEQTVADWKEQARSITTYHTTQEAEPVTFKTIFDAEQHFKKTYLPQLVKTGTTLECSGHASRAGADRHVSGAVRAAWEAESRFPQQVAAALCRHFNDASLHFFKHRKRMLFVCANKPQRHAAGQVFSDGIAAILQAVGAAPRIKRPQLATRLLGEPQDTPEATARKAQLASDLHYLLLAGHVIEFADGGLELPLDPKAKPEPAQKPAGKVSPAVEKTAGDAEPDTARNAETAVAEPERATESAEQVAAVAGALHVGETAAPVTAETVAEPATAPPGAAAETPAPPPAPAAPDP